MERVIMLSMGRDELQRMLEEVIERAANDSDPIQDSFVSHLVDRNYLRRNFKWGRRKIEEFERANQLKPVFTGDAKSHLYRLGECIKLSQKLSKL